MPDNPGWGGRNLTGGAVAFFFGGLCAPGHVAQVKKKRPPREEKMRGAK